MDFFQYTCEIEPREQRFSLDGASAALAALATIVILTLVFPNYTVTTPGPYYSPSQLALIAIVTLVVSRRIHFRANRR